MLIYIAGPYSPDNGMTIKDNISKAESYARKCWENNIPAICPQKNTAYMDDIMPEYFYMGDLDILERCDAVLMVDGWEKSFGARMERIHALRNNIPVFESFDGLWRYCEGMKDD